jgi:hypothetical protein
MAFDFPNSPTLGQVYTSSGVSFSWNGYGWQTGSGGSEAGVFVLKVGDTMSGPLTLSGAPTAPDHAVTKQYVDDLVALPRQR